MSCTVEELMAKCEEAKRLNVQYVYGAKWQVLSLAQIKSLRSRYGSGCVWESDNAKAGKLCCDCSGLISAATGITRGSSQYKSTALEVIPIAKRKPSHRGYAVWRQGHIGIYDGNGGYYAMDGSARNAVHNPLSMNDFTYLLKLCDVDYGDNTAKAPLPAPAATASGGAYNDKVNCQYRIKTLNRGWINAIAGSNTAENANDAITGIAITVSKNVEKLKYRVHIKGGNWLPWVTGYNINDHKNGYAGNGQPIDAVEIQYGANGKRSKYRVATVGKSFYPYQYESQKTGGQDGYAGSFGKPIVKFELEIV